jgi:hypothetical protein
MICYVKYMHYIQFSLEEYVYENKYYASTIFWDVTPWNYVEEVDFYLTAQSYITEGSNFNGLFSQNIFI